MAGTPKPPSSGGSPPKSKSSKSSGGSGGGGGGSSSKSSGGGGGGGSDPYARARADAKTASNKAAARLAAQAARLGQQAAALKIALGSSGFKAELNRQLANANIEFSEEDALILGQYTRGKTALEQQKATTEDQRSHSLQEAGQNSGRERQEALQQGIANGISATDMLKAQGASLRNWSFNANQVQTNYTDEVNGLQSEHSQMVNSVITGRQTAWREREQQRSQLYRGYYDNRSQAETEIGNKLGEAAQYWDMANEQKSSGSYTGKAKSANKSALAYLNAAAKETGKGYRELATPDSVLKWKGNADLRNTSDARQWGQQALELKDAEGASNKLRKWES
jgi:hypothetical protein